MKMKFTKPSIPTRLWISSVFAAVFYTLFLYDVLSTETQLAFTLLTSAICGLSPKIPGNEIKDEKDSPNNPIKESAEP